MLALNFCTVINISIHALLAESDRPAHRRRPAHCHFYPRSPCGERPAALRLRGAGGDFYPRSPCGERLDASAAAADAPVFLSTLSLRRATV